MIAVLIEYRKIREAVAGARSEQFATIVDVPVGVLVNGQKTAALRESGNRLRPAVGVGVKAKRLPESYRFAIKIDDQRVAQLNLSLFANGAFTQRSSTY